MLLQFGQTSSISSSILGIYFSLVLLFEIRQYPFLSSAWLVLHTLGKELFLMFFWQCAYKIRIWSEVSAGFLDGLCILFFVVLLLLIRRFFYSIASFRTVSRGLISRLH